MQAYFPSNYDRLSSSIDIVGTTVVPEFGLTGLVTALSILMLASLGLRSLLRHRQR